MEDQSHPNSLIQSVDCYFLFLLFLFGIGYSVGPQFVQSMQRDGLKSLILSIFCTLMAVFRIKRPDI